MALARTTLSAAVAADANEVMLTSISSLSVGMFILVDAEVMRVNSVGSAATVPVGVVRGQRGTNAAAHVSGAGAVYGVPADFTGTNASRSKGKQREVATYAAAGAISAPVPGRDAVAIINGTSALAMTLSAPSKENEGDILIVVGNGKAAHTITYSNGFGEGGSSYDVLTYASGARNCSVFIAINESWVLCPSLVGGTATAVTQTIA